MFLAEWHVPNDAQMGEGDDTRNIGKWIISLAHFAIGTAADVSKDHFYVAHKTNNHDLEGVGYIVRFYPNAVFAPGMQLTADEFDFELWVVTDLLRTEEVVLSVFVDGEPAFDWVPAKVTRAASISLLRQSP